MTDINDQYAVPHFNEHGRKMAEFWKGLEDNTTALMPHSKWDGDTVMGKCEVFTITEQNPRTLALTVAACIATLQVYGQQARRHLFTRSDKGIEVIVDFGGA